MKRGRIKRIDEDFDKFVMDYKMKNDITSYRQATKDIAKILRMKKFKNDKINWEVKF